MIVDIPGMGAPLPIPLNHNARGMVTQYIALIPQARFRCMKPTSLSCCRRPAVRCWCATLSLFYLYHSILFNNLGVSVKETHLGKGPENVQASIRWQLVDMKTEKSRRSFNQTFQFLLQVASSI